MTISTRQRAEYLESMGIMRWLDRRRPSAITLEDSLNDTPSSEAPAHPAIDLSAARPGGHEALDESLQDEWRSLQAQVAQCTQCVLHESRTQTVFGVGNSQAQWMIIGEAPGAEEDRQGEPFVGRAGKLLNNMLLAVGLARTDVYIANILKCRPPNNRDPRPEEVLKCEPFLHRQVELIQPKVILAVGRIAAQNLLKSDLNVGRLRGKVHQFGARKIPLVVTYHPAYLLRSPREKAKAWQDLLLANSALH